MTTSLDMGKQLNSDINILINFKDSNQVFRRK